MPKLLYIAMSASGKIHIHHDVSVWLAAKICIHRKAGVRVKPLLSQCERSGFYALITMSAFGWWGLAVDAVTTVYRDVDERDWCVKRGKQCECEWVRRGEIGDVLVMVACKTVLWGWWIRDGGQI